MDIYSLNREQINILKGMYLGETQGNASWGELADADKLVADKEVFLTVLPSSTSCDP